MSLFTSPRPYYFMSLKINYSTKYLYIVCCPIKYIQDIVLSTKFCDPLVTFKQGQNS
jgi:hypothetical protein